jgi:hypothetical protein
VKLRSVSCRISPPPRRRLGEARGNLGQLSDPINVKNCRRIGKRESSIFCFHIMVQMLMQRPQGPLGSSLFLSDTSVLKAASVSSSSSSQQPRSHVSHVSLINVQASTEKQRESIVGPNGIARSEGGRSSSCQGKLRLFVDSANVNTWRQWLPSGTFYGLFFKLNLCCKPLPEI